MRRVPAAGPVLCAALLVGLSACSGPAPSTGPAPTSPSTTAAAVATCASSAVTASVDFTKFGGSSSSLAGAVLFRDIGGAPCALRGVPDVRVLAPDAQVIATFPVPGPDAGPGAVLTPAPPMGTGVRAASSITFSSWTCPVGSFSLDVRFPGWAAPVPAATDPAVKKVGPACTQAQETDQTIYMSPVTAVTG